MPSFPAPADGPPTLTTVSSEPGAAGGAPAPSPSRRFRLRRPGRLFLVRTLVVLGTILLLVSVLAIWVNRLALDTDTWADTSEQLLEDENIQAALGLYLTDQLYASVDVQAELESRLPPVTQPLAGPISAGLREVTQRAATRLLSRPRVISLWVESNRIAHQQFVNAVEGGGAAVQTRGGDVVLLLGPLVADVAERTGLGENVVARIPENGAGIVILQSNELESLQTLMRILDIVATWLWAVALALWALAVYLSRGRRLKTLRGLAYGLLFVGLAVLVILRVGGNFILESIVNVPEYELAAADAFDIVTATLKTSAWVLAVIGLLLILGTWLAGPGRRATTFRQAAAPVLRDRAGLVWGAFALIVLLVLLWGPIAATRNLIGIVVLVGLAALGLEAFRRFTVREASLKGP
jgi:hypothetical protein